MITHNSVAKAVRLDKEARPERYCPDTRCLWKTGGGWCPRHDPRRVAAELAARPAGSLIREVLAASAARRAARLRRQGR